MKQIGKGIAMKARKQKNKIWATTLALLVGPLSAHAVPSAYNSQCGALEIDNTTTSTIIRDNKDCRQAYVLPPASGKAQLTGFSPNANLGFCAEMKDLQATSRRVVERIEQTSKRIDEMEPAVAAASRKLELAKKELLDVTKTSEMQLIGSVEDEVATIEAQIERTLESLNTCESACAELQREYRELRVARREAKNELRGLREQHAATVKRAEKARRNLESAQFAYDEVFAPVDRLVEQQSALRTQLLEWYAHFAKMEGGTAHVDYNTGWEANIDELSAKYSNKYNFKAIDTKDARIFANFVGSNDKESYLSSMPAILDYSLAGLKYQPYGDEEKAEGSEYESLSALPARIQGSIRLSLVGGCPLYYKDFLDSDTLTPDENLEQKYAFALSASYKYPAAFALRMKASYNLYKFYERIAKSSSKGGLFSRKHYQSVVEKKVDKDTFHIDWEVEDPDSIYTAEKREEIATALKAELIGRVLGTMAQPVFSSQPVMNVSTAMPAETGAIVLARGLEKTCGYASVWCTGGAWLLRGLDAIFGSSKSESYYRATHDRTATEEWNVSSTTWRTGSTGFSGEF